MRRKDKHIVTGVLIGFGALALFDIIRQWLEHRERKVPFTWEKYNGVQTLKTGLLGGIAGGGIGYLVYKYKISEEENLPFNSDEYLKKALSLESLKAEPGLMKTALSCKEQIKQWLVDTFGNDLVCKPQDSGSVHKKTAIVSNFDFDIILPFKKGSYTTLEAMYNDVYEKIGKTFSDVGTITKHTKAICLTLEEKGHTLSFDIVPGREINNYLVEKDLNLFVRPELVWERGSSFKTNVGIQKTITVNKPEARRVIKLLKLYRDRNGLPLPSLIVDQCVVDALSNNRFGIHRSDTENLLNSMSYIAEKLESKKMIDFANSNNNLNDKVSNQYRSHISKQLLSDVRKIEENPRYIKEIFEC